MTFQRRVVFVDSGNLAEQADDAWDAIAAWSTHHDPPRILVKDGVLARATERSLEPYDRPSLREEASRAAHFVRTLATGQPSPRYPPAEVIDALLRRDPREYVGVPRVTAVVDIPVVTPEGTLLTSPGMDASGLYYRPSPDLAGWENYVFDTDHLGSVTDARDYLMDHLLGDFDFIDESDKANALGLVLLPFLRHHIGSSPTPMHAIYANSPGSGKTYLVQAALIPGCGLVGLAPAPRDAEELRKLITSSLLSARQAIVFDNLSSKLASGTLASALTSRIWQDRVLGQSKEVDLQIRCVWATTGNNIDVSPELMDRTCAVMLDAHGKPARHRPSESFKHSDLHGWAMSHRRELVGACITLIENWLRGSADVAPDGTLLRHDDHERVRFKSKTALGSFERWADVVGGVLSAAGVQGFLGNKERASDAMDVESQETHDFLEAWLSQTSDALRLEELAALCQLGAPLRQHLPASLDTRDVTKSLRYWLRSHRGQAVGGLMLQGAEPRPLRWSVVRI